MNLHFDNAWLLYFLWLIPTFAVWWVASHKKTTRAMNAFIAPPLQKTLFPNQSKHRQLWQMGLATVGLLLLFIAIARPKWGEREETVYKQARDLVIAVDVSRSMLANDVHPTRLGRAKIDLIDLIKELNGDRAALIAFRAKAALVCPLTTDYSFLRQALDGISPTSAPRGETDIGSAIEKALDAFDTEDSSHKAIILISDGEDLSGRAQELAQKAGEEQIPIYTIGLGSSQGSRIPSKDSSSHYIRHKNEDVVTKLDHDSLYAIAKASGGSYIPVETASMTSTTLGTIYRDHLRNITTRELAETRETRAIERYQWFLFPGICFLFGACSLSRGRLASGPQPRSAQSTESKPRFRWPFAAPKGSPSLKNLPPPKRERKQLSIAFFLISLLSLNGFSQSTATNAATMTGTNSVASADEPSTEVKEVPAGRRGARDAQQLFKRGKFKEAADAYLQAANGVSRQANRDFRYNAAIAHAEAGEHKEAAELFRSLSLQARRGERDTNQELGATLYRTAESLSDQDADQAKEREQLFRDAGEAFKESLRKDTNNSEARDNVAIAINRVTEAEEQAHILAINKQHAETQAPQLVNQMLTEQREIAEALPAAITNTTPDRIRLIEDLAARQKALADLWIPLKGKMAEAMSQQGSASNAQHFAALNQLMESTQESMQSGAHKLRDLDSEGFRSAKVSEHGTYQLWKTVASHDLILKEDLRQQTNTIAMTSGEKSPDPYSTPEETQREAAQLTTLFKERFEQAVPEEGLPAPPPPRLRQEQPTESTQPNSRAA
jgi:Ca-activated chloride channel family protein